MEARGLTKTYSGQTVLFPLDLDLRPGEAVGLTGANGSGKSTLLSLLAQTVPPDGGSLTENGRSVLGDRAFLNRSIGYVPQGSALIEDLTVAEQLRVWQSLTGRPIREDRALLALLDLEALGKKRISRLSGGMKKRVSFALALAGRPRYLLMDEAFSALDAAYRARLTGFLADHIRQSGAMLWCTHEPDEAAALCTRVLRLREGRLVQE